MIRTFLKLKNKANTHIFSIQLRYSIDYVDLPFISYNNPLTIILKHLTVCLHLTK